ncbi:MAG: AAA family ATPase [Phycisphaerales bacterium]|nr:AAA family ATPase [Phycisphaerales bacterium]
MTSELRTFQAATMPEALARVKRELGADAVILGTRSLPPRAGGLLGSGGFEITAAPHGATGEQRGAVAKPADTGGRLTPELQMYYTRLVEQEVADELAMRIVRRAAARAAAPGRLKAALIDVIRESVPTTGGIGDSDQGLRRVALIGPPGCGKTTTIAKLAAQLSLKQKRRVALLSIDMHRMATGEQVRRYAELLGVEAHVAQTEQCVRDLCRGLHDVDTLLIDTPGVGPRDPGRLARLAAMLRAARVDETHLVIPVTWDARRQAAAAERFKGLGVTRVTFTGLDEAVGLGVVLNAIDRLQLEVSYLCDGQIVPNDLREASPERIARAICG